MPMKKVQSDDTGSLKRKNKPGQGRKSSFDPRFIKTAFQMALLGATNGQMAKAMDISTETLNQWMHKCPEFKQSILEGREMADAQVAKSLFQSATGYSHPELKVFCNDGKITTHRTVKHYPPNATSAIFWLKNRSPEKWRDRQSLEHSGPNGGPIESTNILSSLSTETLEKVVKEYEEKRKNEPTE